MSVSCFSVLSTHDQVDVWVTGVDINKSGNEVLGLTMLGAPPIAMRDIKHGKIYEGACVAASRRTQGNWLFQTLMWLAIK